MTAKQFFTYKMCYEEALNIYINPNNDISDVGEYLNSCVASGKLTTRESKTIMDAIYGGEE